MSTNGTPGPWFIESHGIMDKFRGRTICIFGDSDQDDADLELVASAPRLRDENEAWMSGVADAVEPLGYDREAACGPADLLPGVKSLAEIAAEALMVVDKVRDAFSFMSALNGAYEGATAQEVRDEVNGSLDWFMADLNALMGRADVMRMRGYLDEEEP